MESNPFEPFDATAPPSRCAEYVTLLIVSAALGSLVWTCHGYAAGSLLLRMVGL